MTVLATFPTGDPLGQPITATRLTTSALVSCDSLGKPRLGVIPDALAPIVVGRATMGYNVSAFRAVVSRSGNGVDLVANDGVVTVATTAAPASNYRLDVVYVLARFALDGDALNTPLIGVAQGATAPLASLVKPTIPAGALELATVQIQSGATTTIDSRVIITNTAPYTAAAGGLVYVRNATELTAWTPLDGATAFNLADNSRAIRNAGAWKTTLPDTDWITPTLGSFWSGTPSELPSYKRENGWVKLRGRANLTFNAAGLTAFTLPPGFRPGVQQIGQSDANGTGVRYAVDGLGVTRVLITSGNLVGFSFGGIPAWIVEG